MTQLRLGYDLVGSWINESWMQGNNTTCVLRSIGLSASQWPMTWLASHTSPTTQPEPTKLTFSQSRRSTQRQPITLKQLTSANHVKAHSDSQSCQSTQWQPITTKHTTTANHTKAAYDSTQWQPITSKHPMTANHVKAHSDSQSCQSTLWQQITSKHITAANH